MGTGKGTGKSMRTRLSKLPFSNLPLSFSQTKSKAFSATKRGGCYGGGGGSVPLAGPSVPFMGGSVPLTGLFQLFNCRFRAWCL